MKIKKKIQHRCKAELRISCDTTKAKRKNTRYKT